MKRKILTLFSFAILASTFAQNTESDEITDKNIKSKILEDIQVGLDTKTKTVDSTINKLDRKLDDLDKAISNSRTASEKADKLFDRVQGLEKRQTTMEENELNIYQANYQSAVINLVSMEREIKPLILFNSTRDLFTAMAETSNPMSYPGYQEWFSKFKDYIENTKSENPSLGMLSSMLNISGTVSKLVPLYGPLTETLFSGMSSFISSMGSKKKEMKADSEKMFLLTAKIAQFTHDKGIIEHEWVNIAKELDELQKHYDDILKQNLKILVINESDFKTSFSKENDANKRYDYLTVLKQKAGNVVSFQRRNNSKDWKEKIYYQLMDVQSLKLRFGNLTFKISENINVYKTLVDKYKGDAHIGAQVSKLENKLDDLKDTFDRAFMPIDYINSATRMYKVN